MPETISNNEPVQPAVDATIFNVMPNTMLPSQEPESWVKRHRAALGIAAIAAAGGLSMTHLNDTVNDVEHAAVWAAPAIAVTETLAWGGAGLMLLSAGKKIGNPLTVKTRLNEIASELENNKAYQRGWTVNVLGASGTAAVIAIGAVTSLPETSWPLAFTASGASLAFSALPLKNVGKKSKEQ